MPTSMGNFAEVVPIAFCTTFLPADASTAKNIYSAATGPYRIDAISFTSDDTAARVIDIFLRITSTNYLLGSVSIPAGSGTAGAVPKEFFESISLSQIVGMNLQTTVTLQAAMESTITAAKTVTVTVLGGMY